MTQLSNHESLLTVGEVAKILRVDATTVRRWIKRGAIPAISLPHCNIREQFRIKATIVQTILEGVSDVLV